MLPKSDCLRDLGNDRNHYFGFGLILKPKPILSANTVTTFQRENLVANIEMMGIFSILKVPLETKSLYP